MCYLFNYELPNLVPQTYFHKPVGVDALEPTAGGVPTRRGVLDITSPRHNISLLLGL